MTDTLDPRDRAAALRVPFPPEAIGKIPKGGMMLDYVGHAAVTDRLLSVDPAWTWEPAGVTEHGLPQFDGSGGLWIKLTVCGITRYGYGDGPDPKQCISDAIRNAAMRFGVALDLWSKEDLQASPAPQGSETVERTRDSSPAAPVAGDTPAPEGGESGPYGEGGTGDLPSEAQLLWEQFEGLCKEADVKPVLTLTRVSGKPAKVSDLRAGKGDAGDLTAAIAHVAGLLLGKGDA